MWQGLIELESAFQDQHLKSESLIWEDTLFIQTQMKPKKIICMVLEIRCPKSFKDES